MNTSHTRRWGLAQVLVGCAGLAIAVGITSPLWHRGGASFHSPTAAAALKKGLVGFDFTRIGRSGTALERQDAVWQSAGTEADGGRWDCVRDNVTGLWWEAKTPGDAGGVNDLRNVGRAYSRSGALEYTNAVNAAGLCGQRDWRLPTVTELKGLTSINKGGATIDVLQFPHTVSAGYWTASAYPHRKNYVWYVYFAGAGDAFGDAPSANYAVRLVREGP